MKTRLVSLTEYWNTFEQKKSVAPGEVKQEQKPEAFLDYLSAFYDEVLLMLNSEVSTSRIRDFVIFVRVDNKSPNSVGSSRRRDRVVLRWWPAKPLGFSRMGSNPIDVEYVFYINYVGSS
jgi:hypothetical protein